MVEPVTEVIKETKHQSLHLWLAKEKRKFSKFQGLQKKVTVISLFVINGRPDNQTHNMYESKE
jgi:hypothetical protein